MWQELKAALLAAKQDWDVWTDWYEARLQGKRSNQKLEVARATIPNNIWKEGPAVVNADIKLLISENELDPDDVFENSLREFAWESGDSSKPESLAVSTAPQKPEEPPPIEVIPAQVPTATTFGLNSFGLIDVVPDPPAHGTTADALQSEHYEETRLKAQALVALGPNQLGDLNDPAKRFREGLKDRIEDISITSTWSRGNTLRSRLKAHDLSMSNAEPDPARLPPLVVETLRDLVGTWNIFIVGDPKGRELDEIRLGPQDVESARQVVAAAAPLVEALQHSENVATPMAIEAVGEQAETAKTATSGIDGDQAIDLSRKTSGNVVVELLRNAYAALRTEPGFAWKEYRAGFYRQAGAAAFNLVAGSAICAGIIAFVVRYADALKGFVTAAWHNPTLVEIIDFIVRVCP
jgi:hypothetical protein